MHLTAIKAKAKAMGVVDGSSQAAFSFNDVKSVNTSVFIDRKAKRTEPLITKAYNAFRSKKNSKDVQVSDTLMPTEEYLEEQDLV